MGRIRWPNLVFPPINLYTLPAKSLSPCISKCNLEAGSCTGCKRTLEEIQDWTLYSDREKLDIMKELEKR